ncbi:MAG: PGF-pre-PGF domain-containing protein [Nanoarchaeota archaeon]|nr:PGF-pre-PGF domain-containing protein [Nanoarchaeota archaeon]
MKIKNTKLISLITVAVFFFLVSGSANALDFNVTLSPNLTRPDSSPWELQLNFTIDHGNIVHNITELAIIIPNDVDGLAWNWFDNIIAINSTNATANPTYPTPAVASTAYAANALNENPTAYNSYQNISWPDVLIINSSYQPQHSFWFNITCPKDVGKFNFTVWTKDSNNAILAKNVSLEIRGLKVNMPLSHEYGIRNVTIGLKMHSNRSFANVTCVLSNKTKSGSSNVPWNSSTLAYQNITTLDNATTFNFTDLPKSVNSTDAYFIKCYATDLSNVKYTLYNMSSSFNAFTVAVRNFAGTVKNETAALIEKANVSMYKVILSSTGPPTEELLSSTTTNANGIFTFTDLNISTRCPTSTVNYPGLNTACLTEMYKVRIKYNTTANVTHTGPITPAFPKAMVFGFEGSKGGMEGNAIPPSLNGSTFYLQPATTLRLYAHNGTKGSIGFGYEIIDQNLGFPIETNIRRSSASSIDVVVPLGRNYTVMMLRDPLVFSSGAECADSGMPSDKCPSPPQSESVTITSADNGTIIDVNKSLHYSEYRMYGCIDVTGNTSAVNVTQIVQKLVPWQGFIPPMDAKISNINLSDNATLNYSDARCIGGGFAFYNISVMGSTSGIDYLMEFYAANQSSLSASATEHFMALPNVTVTANTPLNITLRKLVGNYKAGGSGNSENTSKVKITLMMRQSYATGQDPKEACHPDNATEIASGKCAYATDSFIEIELKDNYIYGGNKLHYMIQSIDNVGTFYMPMLASSKMKIKVYSQRGAPIEKTIRADRSNNITIYPFAPFDPQKSRGMNSSEKSGMNICFYRNSASCNKINRSDASCLLNCYDAQSFNPMQAMLAGKVNLKVNTSKVDIYFINVDLLASGPPNPDMTENPFNSSLSASSFTQAWQFGSMAPKLYDYVYVGVKYNSSVNEGSNWHYNMTIPKVYDEDGNKAWSYSDNGTAVPEEYSEYNGTEYIDFLTGNMLCNNSIGNSNFASSKCYMETTGNWFWLKIPHFSLVEPTSEGLGPGAATTTTTTTTTSSAGGTPLGIAVATTWATIEVNENIKMEIHNSNIPITEIAFTSLKELSDVKIKVKEFKDKPEELVKLSDKTYKYMEIEKENIENDDISKVEIRFKVDKSWLKENGLKSTEISLFRFEDDAWNQLKTDKVLEDEESVKYIARTDGLSYLAIGEKIEAVAEEKEEEEPEEEAKKESFIAKITESKSHAVLWSVIGGILILGILGLVLWLVLRKK